MFTPRNYLCLLLILLSLPAFAITWVGGAGDWEDPSNWDTGVVPGTNDDVVLLNGDIVINSAVLISSLIVESSATLIVAPGADLAIDPTGGPTFALDVAGKVEVHGTVRRGGIITTLASLRVNVTGSWQTLPGGELIIELGYLKIGAANAIFNNRGNLRVENNTLGIQVDGVLLNWGNIDCLGISASFDAVEISNTGQFMNYNTLNIEGFFFGIDNDNRLYNRGMVIIDDCNNGIDNSGRVDNKISGTIQIMDANSYDMINNRSGSRIRNWGAIDVEAIDAFYGLDNQGRVDNYASGSMTFNGEYNFGVIKSSSSGDVYNYGSITFGNNNLQTTTGFQNDGDFINYDNGELLFWGDYDWNCVRNQNNFTNYGYCDFDGEVENREDFIHTDCGEMEISGGIFNFAGGFWLNESILRLDGIGGFSNNNSQFINNSVIEDPFNIINPANIDNVGIIAQTQSSLYTGVTSNFLVVGNPGAANLYVSVYDAVEGNEVGEYDPESNKLWLENSALGLAELYLVDENCEFWFVVQVTGGVQSLPSSFIRGGVKNSEETAAISAYPNPSIGHVYLLIPGALSKEPNYYWEVYNTMGQLQLEGRIFNVGQIPLDLTKLPAGIYVVQMRDMQGTKVFREQIVKY